MCCVVEVCECALRKCVFSVCVVWYVCAVLCECVVRVVCCATHGTACVVMLSMLMMVCVMFDDDGDCVCVGGNIRRRCRSG